MNYCKRCLYPQNHPLNITFDARGICSGCKIHEEKDQLNWNLRFKKLKKIIEPYKNSNRSTNNCIVPVSGAKDSYFVVHIVKNILKMNPLLVTYNNHYNTQVGIRNLAYLKTYFGCPLITNTVSPNKVKKITKTSIRLMGSIYWHCISGQTVFPVQVACKFKIPLIIWGLHQGVDQVGMFSHTDEVEMTRKYRKEHDLMGFEAEDLVNRSDLRESDLENYYYPHDKEIQSVGVRGIYLNNYIRWDSKAQHENMIKKYNYQVNKQQRTFDTYNNIDCFHYSGLHDYIKYLKWGYGKATDHATREIRLKRLTRKEGIKLLKKYNNKKPKDLKIFLKWIDMKEKVFFKHINRFRNYEIWEKNNKKNSWRLKYKPQDYANNIKSRSVHLKKRGFCIFKKNKNKYFSSKKETKYTLLGRGWI